MGDFGLMLIVAAWFFQFVFVFQKDISIKPVFTGTYLAGVLLLVLDGLMNGQWKAALFNFVILLLVLGIFFLMRRKQEQWT